jgi:hypothetical protein
MLFTHAMPDHVVVCESLPALADLSGMAERSSIQI